MSAFLRSISNNRFSNSHRIVIPFAFFSIFIAIFFCYFLGTREKYLTYPASFLRRSILGTDLLILVSICMALALGSCVYNGWWHNNWVSRRSSSQHTNAIQIYLQKLSEEMEWTAGEWLPICEPLLAQMPTRYKWKKEKWAKRMDEERGIIGNGFSLLIMLGRLLGWHFSGCVHIHIEMKC